MIDEHEWQSILQIVKDGTISGAAKHLFVSQPSLSQCVKKIEKELGTPIFIRHNNTLRLTDAGRIYVDKVTGIKRIREGLLQEIADLNDLKSGTLTIGSSYSRSAWLLADIMPEFHKCYPGIKIIVREGSTARLKEEVLAGTVDFAFLYEPLEDKLIDKIPLTDENVLLAVPMDHPVARRFNGQQKLPFPKISFRRFDGMPFIILKPTRKMREIYDYLCQTTGAQPIAEYEANSIMSAGRLASKGMGATLVTDTMLSSLYFPDPLFYFQLSEETQVRHLVAAYNNTKGLSLSARAFIDIVHNNK